MEKRGLIIFDCDGTLVNSETIHNQAVSDVLKDFARHDYPLEYCLNNFAGKGMQNVIAAIEEREGEKIPDSFLQDYVDKVLVHLRHHVDVVPGAIDAVKILSKNYKICVASNGEREHVLQSLKSVGLYDIFGEDSIFTKSQVARGKPFPDLFLYAAEKMGEDSGRCIVVEDSITGVRAGVAAGMKTIGITAVSHHPEQAALDMKKEGISSIFANWKDILTHIG